MVRQVGHGLYRFTYANKPGCAGRCQMKGDFNVKDNVFDPPQVAALAMRKSDEITNNDDSDRLYTGLPLDFDSYFVMWRRQKVVGVLGDTSNYKTGLMTYIARNASKKLN